MHEVLSGFARKQFRAIAIVIGRLDLQTVCTLASNSCVQTIEGPGGDQKSSIRSEIARDVGKRRQRLHEGPA